MLDSKPTLTNKPHLSLRTKDIVAAYTLLRIVVGVNYFNHGFTRIFDVPSFINSMVTTMQDSGIPEFLVRMSAGLVPPVE